MVRTIALALCSLVLVLATAEVALAGTPVQGTKDTRRAEKSVKKWQSLAERDCDMKFDLWFDLEAYGKYAYKADYPRKRLLGAGYLGLAVQNFFGEVRTACRTFNGNELTSCVPALKKHPKVIFRAHPDLEAKNTDADLLVEGDALVVVHPPGIQWQNGLIFKKIYETFDCDGNEPLSALKGVESAPAGAGGLVQNSRELRHAVESMGKWKAFAEKDCDTTFDIWFDMASFDTYEYPPDHPREKLVSAGYLGLAVSNFFGEARTACRTFGGDLTYCAQDLAKVKRVVFRGHPEFDAKNSDVEVLSENGDLIIVYPPMIQWRTGLVHEKIYESLDCEREAIE